MEMYVWRDDSVLEYVNSFDDTSQTRGGFEMADLQIG